MINTAPLAGEITAAFDGVLREDGVSLHGGVYDSHGTDEYQAFAAALDALR